MGLGSDLMYMHTLFSNANTCIFTYYSQNYASIIPSQSDSLRFDTNIWFKFHLVIC